MEHAFDDSGRRLTLKGALNESANFKPILERLQGAVTVDLAPLKRINSAGVREWIGFVRAIPAGVQLTLESCPVMFVNQMNMIASFTGPARVASIMVPFLCPRCGKASEQVVKVDDLASLMAPSCAECGAQIELDAVPEQYFAFRNTGSGGV